MIIVRIGTLILVSWFLVVTTATTVAALEPVQLRCEYVEVPRGIDNAHPRLSWKVVSGNAVRPRLPIASSSRPASKGLAAAKGTFGIRVKLIPIRRSSLSTRGHR